MAAIKRHYRDYKYFDQIKFKNKLNKNFSEGISDYEPYETTFTEVLNKHAPLARKFLRLNHAPNTTKTLGKLLCVDFILK